MRLSRKKGEEKEFAPFFFSEKSKEDYFFPAQRKIVRLEKLDKSFAASRDELRRRQYRRRYFLL